MNIRSGTVYKLLSHNEATDLYHANSVATACHFIRQRSLLSRGTVERLGLTQTSQVTDAIDKRYSLWFDVFMDSVDIHDRASRANFYGPVLFVFDLRIIHRNNTGAIWITKKKNPSQWKDGDADGDRWFQGRKDLNDSLVIGEFGHMIVLRHCGGALPFGRHLKEILLDDPEQEDADGVDIYSMAHGALRSAMQDSGGEVPITRRICARNCSCKNYWSKRRSQLRSIFDPLA